LTETADERRTRDPERTRAAVLDAAEEIFARKGYDAASVQEIADAAGVSRGTPGYVFGSKAQLYRAVMERVWARVWEVMGEVDRQAQESGRPELGIMGVMTFFDFVRAHPSYVRLIEWEALSGRPYEGEEPPQYQVIRCGLGTIRRAIESGPFRDVDPAHLMVSMIAMAWFPLAHAETMLPAVGLDASDPNFADERKRHIVELLLSGIRAPDSS
jgi:AcrR family transcriptional regulator